jgi:hypothetical protein
MLMDIELFETLNRAKNLEKDALLLMAYHYAMGEKVAKDRLKSREMLLLFIEDENKDYKDFEYGRVYSLLAISYHLQKNFRTAHYYYSKG